MILCDPFRRVAIPQRVVKFERENVL
jgi:hypothetical protein